MKTPIVVSLILSSALSAYELHEWGTFTTVSGSDGKLLSGLHVEEEHLPPFVHSHVGMQPTSPYPTYLGFRSTNNNGILQSSDQIAVSVGRDKSISPLFTKGMFRSQLENVTVKMETPVIYFYGDDCPQVNVKVGFNGGTISQWYPKRKAGDTPNAITLKNYTPKGNNSHLLDGSKTAVEFNKVIDFAKPYQGFIEWDVEVLPQTERDIAHTFKPDENYTWIYPRVADANMLKVGDEYEDYLFYRGIGNFELPATFSVDENETLTISNNSKEPIPFALAFENINGKFRYKILAEISPHSTDSVKQDEWLTPKNQQVEIFQAMRAGLVAQGLTTDEANGMVRTWWKSYFNKPGLRVFWVLPDYELEKILPLSLTPPPEKIVRAMVGRADVLRPSFEQKMATALGTRMFDHYTRDRFYLPYKQRLEQLITEPVFSQLTEQGLNFQSFTVKAVNGNNNASGSVQFVSNTDVRVQSSYAEKDKALPLAGAWKIIDSQSLQIGEHQFVLDSATGVLTATLPEGSEWQRYEIQLKRYLN